MSEEIKQNGNASTGAFHPLQCDISDQQQLEDAFIKIEKNYGIPSILVNNAALGTMKKLDGRKTIYQLRKKKKLIHSKNR